MLDAGDVAPDFSLIDDAGRVVTLSGLVGEGPVLVYFYPADFTPGCTAQACSFRDAHERLADAGLTIVGVSPQSVESHARFREAHRLNFPLLADPDKRAIRAFGVAGPFGLVTRRATFQIVPEEGLGAGRIARRVLADLNIAKHAHLVDELASEASARANPAG